MKKIVFITGTRADFGKLKPLIQKVSEHPSFEYYIFATGMHMLSRYGLTVEEIYKAGFKNIFTYMNQVHAEPMEMALANTITGLSRYLHEVKADILIVHGDRVETLAGAIVGALRNILVGHIEGGEISGTIDDLIRHSASKLAHLHFVANKEAEERLIQLGENYKSIHIIGSPDIDVMLSDSLPEIEDAKTYYEIKFNRYALALYHPVTTESSAMEFQANEFTQALVEFSAQNFIVIYPNNDAGCNHIFKAYRKLKNQSHIKMYPSLRFEMFLTILKHADFIVGNSSAGIREAPVFGVPTVNIGSRQQNRFNNDSILNVSENKKDIISAMKKASEVHSFDPCHHFGVGNSAEQFINVLNTEALWNTPIKKTFQQLPGFNKNGDD
jgi:UDP-N-acetylglucosamine 2-epimerase (hydrolysing)